MLPLIMTIVTNKSFYNIGFFKAKMIMVPLFVDLGGGVHYKNCLLVKHNI